MNERYVRHRDIFLEDKIMKTWKNAEVVEVSINETAGGFFDVDWEGPFNIVFGDKSNDQPTTPDPVVPVQPEVEPGTPSSGDDPISLRS